MENLSWHGFTMPSWKWLREPKNVLECLRLVSWVQFVICCSGFFERAGRLVLNRWTRLYSLSGACLAVFGLAASAYGVLQMPLLLQRLKQLDKLVLSIVGMELLLASLVFLITVCSLVSRAQQHASIYQRLAEIDRHLETGFGARLNYAKLRRKHILVLSVVVVVYLGAVNTGIARLANGHHLGIVLPASTCYMIVTGGPHLTGYVHMSLAELLAIRFRLLQRILQPQRFQQSRLNAEQQLRQLRTLVKIVKQLHYLILEINEVYNVALWCARAHDFALSTSELYIIFGGSAASSSTNSTNSTSSSGGTEAAPGQLGVVEVVFLFICMLVPIYKMMIGPVYCSSSSAEGRKCLQLLEQLDSWVPRNPAVHQLVGSTMRWRLQFQIDYTSGTSTILDKTVITLYFSIVSNYLLVLISFATIQKLGEQVEEQRIALKDWLGM